MQRAVVTRIVQDKRAGSIAHKHFNTLRMTTGTKQTEGSLLV
jgi:hypothetical protein